MAGVGSIAAEPSVKRAFVHIGRGKTGTTAIQRALAANRILLAELGFTYPGSTRNHNPIVGELPDGAGAASIAAEVRAAPGHGLISAEGLQNLPAAKVREWLLGLDVQIIVYLRDQAEVIASAYQQAVKAELETGAFEDFVIRCGVQDYRPFLRDWATVFGRENMTIRFYQKDDVVPSFLEVLGIRDHAPFLLDLPDPNPSIAGELLETKRRLNETWTGTAEDLRKETYDALRLLANKNSAWRGSVLDEALAQRIRAAHWECNAGLASEFDLEVPWLSGGSPQTQP